MDVAQGIEAGMGEMMSVDSSGRFVTGHCPMAGHAIGRQEAWFTPMYGINSVSKGMAIIHAGPSHFNTPVTLRNTPLVHVLCPGPKSECTAGG